MLCHRHGILLCRGADLHHRPRDLIKIRSHRGASRGRSAHGLWNTIAPDNVSFVNPAFDVTPAELVTAIVTERGIARAPYGPSLSALCRCGLILDTAEHLPYLRGPSTEE